MTKSTLKLVAILVGYALVFVLLSKSAKAQQVNARPSDAAIAIAANGKPADIMTQFVDCVVKLAPVIGADNARKDCKSVRREDGRVLRGVNDEAADATNNDKPEVLAVPTYGYNNCGTLFCAGDAYIGGYVDPRSFVTAYNTTGHAQPRHGGDNDRRQPPPTQGGVMGSAAQRMANLGTRQYTPPAQQPAPQVRTSGGGGVMGNAAAASYAAYRAQQPQ